MDPALGLHRLKREFQKKYMSKQCDQLTQVLDEAIAVTLLEALCGGEPTCATAAG